jgi:hypothetical protein
MEETHMDFVVTVSPDELWQVRWLVMNAPNFHEAEQAVWTERGYNSGEPVRVRRVRAGMNLSDCRVLEFNQKAVDEARELVRYND